MTEIIKIPIPPSVNGLYGNKTAGGRFKGEKYKAWIKEAGWILVSQHPKKFTQPVDILLRVHPRIAFTKKGDVSKRGVDITNRLKAAEDLLVLNQIIPDDSFPYVMSGEAIWTTQVEDAEIWICRTKHPIPTSVNL